MYILKSQQFEDEELIEYAASMSKKEGTLQDKLLHWDFGPLMTMAYTQNAKNYLFSDGPVPFHWDGAFYVEPRFLLFFCTESQGTGGETIFCNTERIWQSLSESEKERCRKIRLRYSTEKLAHYGGVIEVPLVQSHPVSGRPILRMAEKVTTSLNPVELEILGAEDQTEFYHWLVQKLYCPEFLYNHSWEKGDLVICDNFTYLHGRKALANNLKRSFKRIQIL